MKRLISPTAAAVAVLLTATNVVAGPPKKLVLKGGRIIPVVGQEIANGSLLIENGKIAAVGESIEIPYDAMVYELEGRVVFPGMVDAHSSRGLDVSNERLPVTPFLDVYDALDPSRLYFEDALRDGVTSIHVTVGNDCVIGGISRVVRPIGLTPEEMTLVDTAGIKISMAPKSGWDRMVQMARLRETFIELKDYLGDLAEEKYEESLKEKDEEIDVGPEEARKRGAALITVDDYDDTHRNLVRLTRGELRTFVYCGRAGDVGPAVALAKDNGFFDRMTLIIDGDGYKAIDEIKAAGRPVILAGDLVHRERDWFTGDLKETFIPKVFAEARLDAAILPSPNTSLAERYLNYQAARCVRHGISRRRALRSITVYPARSLGIEDKVGSIEVGKIANLVVFSGDPLDFNSWVDSVYLDGILAYERANDVRLKQLMGQEPPEVEQEEKDTSEDPKAPDQPTEGDG